MNISDFTERLIDADEFNYVRHDTYWCGNVKKDPLTGKYYVWEAKWCAADREGWRPIGSDYESARQNVGRHKINTDTMPGNPCFSTFFIFPFSDGVNFMSLSDTQTLHNPEERHKIPLIRLARLPQKRKRVPFSIASRP